MEPTTTDVLAIVKSFERERSWLSFDNILTSPEKLSPGSRADVNAALKLIFEEFPHIQAQTEGCNTFIEALQKLVRVAQPVPIRQWDQVLNETIPRLMKVARLSTILKQKFNAAAPNKAGLIEVTRVLYSLSGEWIETFCKTKADLRRAIKQNLERLLERHRQSLPGRANTAYNSHNRSSISSIVHQRPLPVSHQSPSIHQRGSSPTTAPVRKRVRLSSVSTSSSSSTECKQEPPLDASYATSTSATTSTASSNEPLSPLQRFV